MAYSVTESLAQVFESDETDLDADVPQQQAVHRYIQNLLGDDNELPEMVAINDLMVISVGVFAAGALYGAQHGEHVADVETERITIELSKESVTRFIESFLEEKQ